MGKSIPATVKPEILVWARESSGLSLDAAAKKLGVPVRRLQAWETGEAHPSVAQLRKMAGAYKRPLAVFYLSSAPEGFAPMRDFRRLPKAGAQPPSPELLLQMRLVRLRRDIALEVSEQLEQPLRPISAQQLDSDQPTAFAAGLRDLLGVQLQTQFEWSDKYEALNGWISALEGAGALVFQTNAFSLEEARGFSIAELVLPAIVANANDSPRGRVFTLLHEFAHVLLHAGGLCDLLVREKLSTDEDRIEQFCNLVAAEALVPASSFLQERSVQAIPPSGAPSEEIVLSLAQKYSVSTEVILRRLVDLGRVSLNVYLARRERFLKAYEDYEEKKKGGYAPFHRVVVRDLGRSYIRLVLDAYHQEAINSSDVADYLGVRLKHLPKIEQELVGG